MQGLLQLIILQLTKWGYLGDNSSFSERYVVWFWLTPGGTVNETNVYLSSVGFHDMHMRAILQELLSNGIREMI